MKSENVTIKTCWIPRSFFQSFFNVFTQISPVFEIFGWNILVRKKPKRKKREWMNEKGIQYWIRLLINRLEEKKRKLRLIPFGGELGKSFGNTNFTRKQPAS